MKVKYNQDCAVREPLIKINRELTKIHSNADIASPEDARNVIAHDKLLSIISIILCDPKVNYLNETEGVAAISKDNTNVYLFNGEEGLSTKEALEEYASKVLGTNETMTGITDVSGNQTLEDVLRKYPRSVIKFSNFFLYDVNNNVAIIIVDRKPIVSGKDSFASYKGKDYKMRDYIDNVLSYDNIKPSILTKEEYDAIVIDKNLEALLGKDFFNETLETATIKDIAIDAAKTEILRIQSTGYGVEDAINMIASQEVNNSLKINGLLNEIKSMSDEIDNIIEQCGDGEEYVGNFSKEEKIFTNLDRLIRMGLISEYTVLDPVELNNNARRHTFASAWTSNELSEWYTSLNVQGHAHNTASTLGNPNSLIIRAITKPLKVTNFTHIEKLINGLSGGRKEIWQKIKNRELFLYSAPVAIDIMMKAKETDYVKISPLFGHNYVTGLGEDVISLFENVVGYNNNSVRTTAPNVYYGLNIFDNRPADNSLATRHAKRIYNGHLAYSGVGSVLNNGGYVTFGYCAGSELNSALREATKLDRTLAVQRYIPMFIQYIQSMTCKDHASTTFEDEGDVYNANNELVSSEYIELDKCNNILKFVIDRNNYKYLKPVLTSTIFKIESLEKFAEIIVGSNDDLKEIYLEMFGTVEDLPAKMSDVKDVYLDISNILVNLKTKVGNDINIVNAIVELNSVIRPIENTDGLTDITDILKGE